MKKKKKPTFSLKDQLFNEERVRYLADLFHDVDASFDADSFVSECVIAFGHLELKERITHIAEVLEKHLPSDYRAAIDRITTALPPPLDPTLSDDDFGDFIIAPLGEYVVRNGMAKKHLKLSLRTLKEITQRFSMEDAIRAFLTNHTEATLAELKKWSLDRNYHVRRLVSEGTRPTLPWSKRIPLQVSDPLPLLDHLYADRTRYVTRSVANHLNDIARTDPDIVIQKLAAWKAEGRQETDEFSWICRHALRSLIKQGHAGALQFLGYSTRPKITVSQFEISPTQLSPGEAFELSCELTARRPESLIVDYVVHFVKAGGRTSPKVHKLKQVNLKKGESTSLAKRHVLHANATTYTLYPGTHRVVLQVNGADVAEASFELLNGDE